MDGVRKCTPGVESDKGQERQHERLLQIAEQQKTRENTGLWLKVVGNPVTKDIAKAEIWTIFFGAVFTA